MTIAILSAWDHSQADLAAVTWPNKKSYCDRHGYDAIAKVGDLPDRHPVWLRIAAARELLPRYDWIFLLDLDTMIMNPRITLESLLPADPDVDLVATYDVHGINTGAILLRNTAWTQDFLTKVWSATHFISFPNAEQTAIAYLLFAEPQAKWRCLPQRSFNSFLYGEYGLSHPGGEYQAGDFILHLPAMPNHRRVEIFQNLV